MDKQKDEDNTRKSMPRNRRISHWPTVAGCVVLAALVGWYAMRSVPSITAGEPGGVLSDQQRADIGSDLARQVASVSVDQQKAVADGQIDVDELMNLARQADACAVKAGVPETHLEWTDRGFERSIQFSKTATETDMNTLWQAANKCWDYNVGVAEQMRALNLVPSVPEQVEFNRKVAECLQQSGVEAKGWPATDVGIDPALEAKCVDKSGAAD